MSETFPQDNGSELLPRELDRDLSELDDSSRELVVRSLRGSELISANAVRNVLPYLDQIDSDQVPEVNAFRTRLVIELAEALMEDGPSHTLDEHDTVLMLSFGESIDRLIDTDDPFEVSELEGVNIPLLLRMGESTQDGVESRVGEDIRVQVIRFVDCLSEDPGQIREILAIGFEEDTFETEEDEELEDILDEAEPSSQDTDREQIKETDIIF